MGSTPENGHCHSVYCTLWLWLGRTEVARWRPVHMFMKSLVFYIYFCQDLYFFLEGVFHFSNLTDFHSGWSVHNLGLLYIVVKLHENQCDDLSFNTMVQIINRRDHRLGFYEASAKCFCNFETTYLLSLSVYHCIASTSKDCYYVKVQKLLLVHCILVQLLIPPNQGAGLLPLFPSIEARAAPTVSTFSSCSHCIHV